MSSRHSEVYFEFHQIGQQVRVSAIDAITGIEVNTIAPKGLNQIAMKRLAMAKLEKRLADLAEEQRSTNASISSKRGIVV